jgi:ATP-binding cassette subfamily D (ALD) protein 3
MTTFSKLLKEFNFRELVEWLVKSKNGRISGLGLVLLILIIVQMKKNKKVAIKTNVNKKILGRGQGNVDSIFFNRLWSLLKLSIPSIKDPIMFEFVLLNIALVLRTVMSINISTINGTIVKSIIQAKFPDFIRNITNLAMYAVPASFINSYLDYLNKKIALRLRSRLTYYFHDSYITGKYFYQVTNVDARIPNPDQRLTEDIDKWSNAVTNLYSNFSKPLLDIILFSKKLSELLGWFGPTALIGWYFGSAVILKFVSPSFGMLYATQQKLEGEFRASHTNLQVHSEEIAFYRGGSWEQDKMNELYDVFFSYGRSSTTTVCSWRPSGCSWASLTRCW